MTPLHPATEVGLAVHTNSHSAPADAETWTVARPTASGSCAECLYLTEKGACERLWPGTHGDADRDPAMVGGDWLGAVLWIREPEQFGCRLWEAK